MKLVLSFSVNPQRLAVAHRYGRKDRIILDSCEAYGTHNFIVDEVTISPAIRCHSYCITQRRFFIIKPLTTSLSTNNASISIPPFSFASLLSSSQTPNFLCYSTPLLNFRVHPVSFANGFLYDVVSCSQAPLPSALRKGLLYLHLPSRRCSPP